MTINTELTELTEIMISAIAISGIEFSWDRKSL